MACLVTSGRTEWGSGWSCKSPHGEAGAFGFCLFAIRRKPRITNKELCVDSGRFTEMFD